MHECSYIELCYKLRNRINFRLQMAWVIMSIVLHLISKAFEDYVCVCIMCIAHAGYSCQAQRQPINTSAVAGVSTNINIRCDIGTDAFFWQINGLVYGALHVPDEYRVCDVTVCNPETSFTIPVVLEEMDGNTFQCFSIDYQNNAVHLGSQTMLTVVPYESAGMRTQYMSIQPVLTLLSQKLL